MRSLTSTEIGSAARLVGEERAVELCAKAGFDAWDFSMFDMANYDRANKIIPFSHHPLHSGDYIAFSKKLRKIGEDNGIHCNQSHAPFPSFGVGMLDYIKRAIECTAVAGGKICIVHPDNFSNAEKNAEMYFELLPIAKEYGIKIATENMWCWDKELGQATTAACSHHDDFLAHIKAVNDPDLVACVDIGHATMRGLNTSPREMLLTLGEHVRALHIHDTDLHHDSHQIPFSMSVDFEDMIKALKEIGYKGYFTLEANTYLRVYTAENIEEGIKNLSDAARKLADMFDAL